MLNAANLYSLIPQRLHLFAQHQGWNDPNSFATFLDQVVRLTNQGAGLNMTIDIIGDKHYTKIGESLMELPQAFKDLSDAWKHDIVVNLTMNGRNLIVVFRQANT